ncbi:hypothetical protein C8J57DRAFT_1672526 [Mycena rebaudengoi]|nr:hypothetical protein C8J57DRAFT_1672526 [Mycena rebaudengoi]
MLCSAGLMMGGLEREGRHGAWGKRIVPHGVGLRTNKDGSPYEWRKEGRPVQDGHDQLKGLIYSRLIGGFGNGGWAPAGRTVGAGSLQGCFMNAQSMNKGMHSHDDGGGGQSRMKTKNHYIIIIMPLPQYCSWGLQAQMDIEFDLEFDSYRISESDTGPCDTSDMGGYSSQCDPAQYFPARHQLDRPTLWPPPQFPDPPHFLTSRMLGTMIPQKPVIFSPPKYTRQLPPQVPNRYSRSRKLSACPTKRPGLGAEAGAPPCADARFPTKSFPFAVPIATLLLRLRRTIGAPSTQNGESSSHAVSLDPLQDPLQRQRSVSLAKSHSGVANSKAVYSSDLPTTQRPIPLSSPATTIYSDAIPVCPRNNGQGIGKARHVSPPRILASVKWKGRAVEDVRISLPFEAWAAVPRWLPLDHLCNRLSAISPHHPARAWPIRQQMQNQRRDFVFDHDIQMLA